MNRICTSTMHAPNGLRRFNLYSWLWRQNKGPFLDDFKRNRLKLPSIVHIIHTHLKIINDRPTKWRSIFAGSFVNRSPVVVECPLPRPGGPPILEGAWALWPHGGAAPTYLALVSLPDLFPLYFAYSNGWLRLSVQS